MLVITKQGGKNLFAAIAFYASKQSFNFFSMQNHSLPYFVPTRTLKFYGQRRFSSQLEILFQICFIPSDTQTWETLQFRFFEHHASKQAAMAVKPDQNAVDFSKYAEGGPDMKNIRAQMPEETLAPHANTFEWRTARIQLTRCRQRATWWNSGMNMNDFLKLFLTTDCFWNDSNMPTDKTKSLLTYNDLVEFYIQTYI